MNVGVVRFSTNGVEKRVFHVSVKINGETYLLCGLLTSAAG